MDNNYNEKLVTERLSQITYNFSNILGAMIYMLLDIVPDLQIYISINYWINNKLIYLILFYLRFWFISGLIY
jgi:hypothetical protein